MAFWGVEIKPGKPYVHSYDKTLGRLRISQAALGNGKFTSKSALQCKVGNKSPVLLCNLIPNVIETCHLEHEFEENEEVVFSVLGQTSVHLSGYYLGGSCCDMDGDESDSYGEDISSSDSSESYSYDDEEYNSDFIDDDMAIFPPSPQRKSGVVIEEMEEDETPSNEKAKKKNQPSDSDDANKKQLVVTSNGSAILESEDEDGFPISSSSKKSANLKSDDDKTVNNEKLTKQQQKKKSRVEKSPETDSIEKRIPVESDKDEKDNAVNENLTTDNEDGKGKKKKKKKKKKVNKGKFAEAVANESVETEDNKDIKEANEAFNNDVMDEEQNKVTEAPPAEETSGKQKKKNKKKRAKENKDSNNDAGKVADVNQPNAKKIKKEDKKNGKDLILNSGQGEKSKVSKAGLKTRTYANGLVIEELAMGKPDGKRATPGKKIAVNYIGKLKTGNIFDSTVGRRPFVFRLGIGQVIKGWDVGINGMRVGDKRRLTIPPEYGYGDQKTGAIPPNSWLSFDVELVSVH